MAFGHSILSNAATISAPERGRLTIAPNAPDAGLKKEAQVIHPPSGEIPTRASPNLAFAYQEILTVVSRLRSSDSDLADSTVFRTQIRKALEQSENIARSLSCSLDDIRLASFATIAFLDETILSSTNPAFLDWVREPMTVDLFETFNASEAFFEDMQAIVKRADSKSTIDLLEVYVLCLALGFRGRYNSGSEEQLRVLRDPVVERILRFRKVDGIELSRACMPEENVGIPAPASRLTRLAFGSCVAVLVAGLFLLMAYHFILSSSLATAQTSLLELR